MICMSRRFAFSSLAESVRQVGALEEDLAAGRLDQAQDRPAERRLAAARLADEPDRLAAADREVDAVHGLDVRDRLAEAGPP